MFTAIEFHIPAKAVFTGQNQNRSFVRLIDFKKFKLIDILKLQ